MRWKGEQQRNKSSRQQQQSDMATSQATPKRYDGGAVTRQGSQKEGKDPGGPLGGFSVNVAFFASEHGLRRCLLDTRLAVTYNERKIQHTTQ